MYLACALYTYNILGEYVFIRTVVICYAMKWNCLPRWKMYHLTYHEIIASAQMKLFKIMYTQT